MFLRNYINVEFCSLKCSISIILLLIFCSHSHAINYRDYNCIGGWIYPPYMNGDGLYDMSDKHNTPTCINQSMDVSDNSYIFNSSIDSVVRIDNNVDYNLYTNEFTVSLWTKPDTIYKSVRVLFCRDSGESYGRIIDLDLYYASVADTRHKVRFRLYSEQATGHATEIYTTTTLLEDVWYHIVGSLKYDNILGEYHLAIYVNGIMENELISTIPHIDDDLLAPFFIGSAPTDETFSTPEDQYSGKIKKVSIFGVGLDAEHVYNLYLNERD